jgi:hypothetical protein
MTAEQQEVQDTSTEIRQKSRTERLSGGGTDSFGVDSHTGLGLMGSGFVVDYRCGSASH